MNAPPIMKSWVIKIHLLSWIIGGVAFGVLALTELQGAMWVCVFAGFSALVSGVMVIPAALVHVFRHREEPMGVRLQFVGAACLAAIILAGFIAFQIMTAGRH